MGNIHICMEYRYNDILLLHGHQFDGLLLKNAKWLQILGSHGYNLLISINGIFNKISKKLNIHKNYQLSKIVKSKIKSAITYMNNYEFLVSDYAKRNGFSTVICGHIHQFCDKVINDVRYMNTGDFVENCSVIVENYDNTLNLLIPQL